MLLAVVARAEDGLFEVDPSQPLKASIEGRELVTRVLIRKIQTPKAKTVILFDSEKASSGRYTVQVHLKSTPTEGWMPIILLGDSILIEGVGVSRSEPMGATLEFGTDDPNKALEFLNRTAKVFGLSKENVYDARTKRVEPKRGADRRQPS